MHMSRLRARTPLFGAALLTLAFVLVASGVPRAATADTNLPDSMASTGDSITRAFNTGFLPFLDAPANSWSTGSNTTVNSLYNRILKLNPDIRGRNYNQAVSGARMADLQSQVQQVNSRRVEYVTILMGANDACRATPAEMTPVATYRSQFQQAMHTLASGSPQARIYVVSIPDVYQLWALFHTNLSAVFTWTLFGTCQSMFANPWSVAPADVARRDAVRQRIRDYNTQLREVCAQYPQCRYDGGAVFNTPIVPADVTTRDYFHPSITGQAKLAATTWAYSGLAP